MISQIRIKKITLALAVVTVVIALSHACGDLEWSCGSGECIAVERLCDGPTDCRDGSDETADICVHQDCPPFAFRCAYGACVPGPALCNGTAECADKSDEASILCEPGKTIQNTICLKDKFQCNSGECISLDDACDGRADCADQSDESVEACASTFCSSIYFRCGYGACIRDDKKCDNVADCLDGSDETLNLCKDNPTWKPLRKPVLSITPAPPQITPPTIPKNTCIVPNITNSRIVTESTRMVLEAGDEVPNMLSIIYECKTGYYREGQENNICYNGKWFSKIDPICTRYCPHEVLSGVTFSVKCIRDGATVSCNNRIKPGTEARISCSNKYRIPEHNPQQRLLCYEDGQWDYQPSRCEPICGEELVPSEKFVVNGQKTNITSVPWHVGVYKDQGGEYKHHCGGTLLNAKVVISAAHCFWDNANQKTDVTSLYSIGAGKYYRNYYTPESRKAQFQNIAKISIPFEYKDEDAKFRADIAVIVLINPFVLSEFVSPICVQWKMDGAKSIANGSYGQVAGWGKDETGDFSEELKTILVTGSSYEVCQNEAGPTLSNSITDDKFCVLNRYNTNACQGDSGGGFAVKKGTHYYLWGVVSTGVPVGAVCNDYQFVSYTNIQYYEGLISELETHNRPK